MLILKKVFFLPLLLMGLFFASCDDTVNFDKQQEIDRGIIEDYVASQNLDGFFTENNIFVSMENEGTGTDSPEISSTVEIIYKGYLLDGTEFDSSKGFPVEFPLYTLIQGWQEGLATFKKGGKGILVIPSQYAYKERGSSDGSIPPNTVIAFDIELLSFD